MASRIPRRAPAYFTRSGGVDARLFERVRGFIETRADAERNRTRNLRSLRIAGGFPRLARQIFRCDDGAPCEEHLCPLCARRYRIWFGGQCLSFAVKPVEAHLVTILLVAVGGGLLHTVDVRTEHGRLRKRLIRCGVRSAIGGTEAAYDAPNDRWVVHVHLLVFGEIKLAIPRLRVMAKRDGFERPVKSQRVCDPVSQLTYLQKFVTYHRPGKASADGKGRAYPLKPRHVAELARWFAPRRFGDFAFLLGFRRRGSCIVAEPSFADIVAEAQARMATWRRGDARKTAPRLARVSPSKPGPAVLPTSSTKAATRVPKLMRIAKTDRALKTERRPSRPSGPRRHIDE